MKSFLLFLAFIAQINLLALDTEITWSERIEKDLPTATVSAIINGIKFSFENTTSGGDGFVSKDGVFILYCYQYDSNKDGLVDFKDNSNLKILKIIDGKPEVFKIIKNVSMFDITSDSRKLLYISIENDGMALNKMNLLDNSDSNVIRGAKWLGHITISQDDHWCALYVNNENIKNRVVVIGSKGSKVISRDVGNGWGLSWVNNLLIFTENNMKDIKFYDPVRDIFISESDIVNPEVFDKKKSGWPKLKKP